MKLRKIIAIGLLAMSCIALPSCGGGDNPNDTGTSQTQKQITITVTGATKIMVGGETKLKVTVKNDSTKGTKYNVSSADESIATVSESGLVKGIGVGKTTLTFSSKQDPTVTYDYEIEVVAEGTYAVEITASATQVVTGQEVNLSSSVTNPDGGDVTYKWKAENLLGKFAKTSEATAVFTPSSVGKEIITLTATIGGIEVTDSIELTIEESVAEYTIISTAEDFKSKLLIAGNIDGKFMLGADIDLGGMVIDGNSNASCFQGTLDGKGYKVSNFSVTSKETNTAGYNNSGMFQKIDQSAVVRNLEVDGTVTQQSIGWGTALLCNELSGTVQDCLFNTTQTYNNGIDGWFPFAASICGILKESGVIRNVVVNVDSSCEGKDVHMAFASYFAGGQKCDGTNANYVASDQVFTITGAYTNQASALTIGSPWEWGNSLEDTSGIHAGINFDSSAKTVYADLDESVWNLVDNQMPTLKK